MLIIVGAYTLLLIYAQELVSHIQTRYLNYFFAYCNKDSHIYVKPLQIILGEVRGIMWQTKCVCVRVHLCVCVCVCIGLTAGLTWLA